MEQIKNTMRYIQLGIAPDKKHNYAMRKWQRILWSTTLFIWRSALVIGLIYLLYNLIY